MIHHDFMQSLLTVFANERVMFQELQNNQTANLSLDLTYYSSEDIYSDGAIEDEILSFVRGNPLSK